jgi:hypothetical protein
LLTRTSTGPAATASRRRSSSLLADGVTRAKALRDLAAGWYGGIPWMWDRVLVTHSAAGDTESPGHDLGTGVGV